VTRRSDERFVEFATACAPHLLRTAHLLTGDWHLAEDLVQETLGRMYAAPLGFGRIDNPAAYARTALTRAFLNHRRRRSAGEVPVAEFPGALEPRAPGRGDEAALRVALQAELARLSPTDRAVVVLRYWEDRSVAEVAAALGISPAAVKNRSSRALGRLRSALGQAGDWSEAADDVPDPGPGVASGRRPGLANP